MAVEFFENKMAFRTNVAQASRLCFRGDPQAGRLCYAPNRMLGWPALAFRRPAMARFAPGSYDADLWLQTMPAPTSICRKTSRIWRCPIRNKNALSVPKLLAPSM